MTKERHERHWVVLAEWCVDYGNGSHIVGIFHSKAEALTAFNKRVSTDDRLLASEYGYKVYQDSETRFDSGREGYYCQDHITVEVVELEAERLRPNIRYDERYYSEERKEWTFYFTAPAQLIHEMFPGKYEEDDVVATELSITIPCEKKDEIPLNSVEGVYVSISPTIRTEDCFEDCDWVDIDLPDYEILELIEKGTRHIRRIHQI